MGFRHPIKLPCAIFLQAGLKSFFLSKKRFSAFRIPLRAYYALKPSNKKTGFSPDFSSEGVGFRPPVKQLLSLFAYGLASKYFFMSKNIFPAFESPKGHTVSFLLHKKSLITTEAFFGRSGIRTHGAREDTSVFKTDALNRSAILPSV